MTVDASGTKQDVLEKALSFCLRQKSQNTEYNTNNAYYSAMLGLNNYFNDRSNVAKNTKQTTKIGIGFDKEISGQIKCLLL